MARGWLIVIGMERQLPDGLDRFIARLAAAVVAADHRITSPELEHLDRIGLGPLGGLVREEIERAAREPVDVAATCAALPPLGEDAATLVLTALAELVTSDRVVALRERDVFRTIAGHLGVRPAAAARILEAAISPNGAREVVPASGKRPALRILGLEPGANRSRIETTYLQLIQRYDPLRMAEELGPDLAALAVRRLATITDAYETALATLEDTASRA
jgi:uncharacterized tellurite resistance protein B-like protein